MIEYAFEAVTTPWLQMDAGGGRDEVAPEITVPVPEITVPVPEITVPVR